jgi:hypothetical protein
LCKERIIKSILFLYCIAVVVAIALRIRRTKPDFDATGMFFEFRP